jgi:hypothetical protein
MKQGINRRLHGVLRFVKDEGDCRMTVQLKYSLNAFAHLQASDSSKVWKDGLESGVLMFQKRCIYPNGRTEAAPIRSRRQLCL